MRKLIPFVCMLALCLCACTAGEVDTAPSTQATVTTNAQDLPMPVEYDTLLQAMVDAFPQVSGLEEYPALSHMYDGHTGLTELGWALSDLDGDGSPELLIKSIESPFIYDAFTLREGALVDLFSGGENDSYRLYEEGLVEVQWSDGLAMGTDYYRLEQGSLVRFDRVVQDSEQAAALGLVEDAAQADSSLCWFRSETDNKADYISITAVEAAQIQQTFKDDNFPLYPVFAPLSDYKK